MRTGAIISAGGMALALACALLPAPAFAQARDSALGAYASASPPSNPMDEPATAATRPLSPEESALFGNALMFDPNSYASTAPAGSLRLPGLSGPQTDISGAN